MKQVVGKVALIESVGSYELLEDIDRQAEKLGIVQPILLEVNVGGEEAKSGFAVSEVRAAAERASALQKSRRFMGSVFPPDGSNSVEYFVFWR